VLVRELRGSGDNADIFKGKMKKFGDIVRTEDLEDCLRYEPEAFIDVAVKQLRTPVESTRVCNKLCCAKRFLYHDM
jgi:hypothetical protein